MYRCINTNTILLLADRRIVILYFTYINVPGHIENNSYSYSKAKYGEPYVYGTVFRKI